MTGETKLQVRSLLIGYLSGYLHDYETHATVLMERIAEVVEKYEPNGEERQRFIDEQSAKLFVRSWDADDPESVENKKARFAYDAAERLWAERERRRAGK